MSKARTKPAPWHADALDFPSLVAAIGKLPEKQRDVLGSICIGQDGGHHPATVKALEAKGLVITNDFQSWDAFGPFRVVKHFAASDRVHMAWCQWASEQPEEDLEAPNVPE